MSQAVHTSRGRVPIDYHQFAVADLGCHDRGRGRGGNGTTTVSPGVVTIHTGISVGNVEVVVEVHEMAPPAAPEPWEDVVEVSMHAPHGQVRVTGIGLDAPDSFPLLTPAGPGHYRVRAHVRGRDIATDLSRSTPVEDYLVQIWPDREQPDHVIKQTDHYGAMLRGLASTTPPAAPEDPARAAIEAMLRRADEQHT